MKSAISIRIIMCALFALCTVAFSTSTSHSFFTPDVVQHGDLKAKEKFGKSPHKKDGDCSVCHVATKDDLNSWFTFGSTKRKMIADHVELCARCHGKGFGHGTGKKPSIARNEIPLAPDGTITCAITCHNMHISDFKDKDQENFYLRYDNVKLCLSCHDK